MHRFADGCSAMGTMRYRRTPGSDGRVEPQLRSLLSCDSVTLVVLPCQEKGHCVPVPDQCSCPD